MFPCLTPEIFLSLNNHIYLIMNIQYQAKRTSIMKASGFFLKLNLSSFNIIQNEVSCLLSKFLLILYIWTLNLIREKPLKSGFPILSRFCHQLGIELQKTETSGGFSSSIKWEENLLGILSVISCTSKNYMCLYIYAAFFYQDSESLADLLV